MNQNKQNQQKESLNNKNMWVQGFNPQKYKVSDRQSDLLGSGSYGKVYPAIHIETKQQIAVKYIKIPQIYDLEKRVNNQIQISKCVIHQNVVKFYGIVTNKKQKRYQIFMEKCDLDLEKLIKLKYQKRNAFTQEQCIVISMQILQAFFSMCPQQKFLHRDLKPSNILLKDGRIKITDYGQSRLLQPKQQGQQTKSLTYSNIGTVSYNSPQILKGQKYTQKCDIWSFGCVIYKILHNKLLWSHLKNNNYQIVQFLKKNRIQVKNEINNSLKSFLLSCLQFQEHDRASWKTLMQHTLVLDYKKHLFCKKQEIIKKIKQFYKPTHIQYHSSLLVQNFINLSQNLIKVQGSNQSINQSTNQSINQKPNKKFQQNQKQKLLKKSNVLKTYEDIKILSKFFTKKIKNFQLVFKASDNKFSIEKFYNKCGDMNNLVILCDTTKGKVIGGYTPLSFNPISNRNEFGIDNTETSFIFSLSNRDKFPLNKDKQAIYRYVQKQGINFAGAVLYIGDKSNQNPCNQTYLGWNFYTNSQYQHNKQSYLKFNGNQSQYFTAKEWEAFKVYFQ